MLQLFIYLILIVEFGEFPHFIDSENKDNIKDFWINGEKVRVTNEADEMFLGMYKGEKSGYLSLKSDGTGEYKYDIFGIAQSGCKEGVIKFEWGFPLDKDNNKVRFKKPYGYSYPIIFKCTSDVCFQGCSKQYIIDFILDKNDGKLHVSSSDDWKKGKY
jgi:hypothetical protein